MRRSLASVLVFGVLAMACTDPPSSAGAGTGPLGVTSASPEPGSSPGSASAEPDPRIPRDPAVLARELESVWTARRIAVDAWVRSGGASTWPPPVDLELLVLREQSIYRSLATLHRLAERVLARVPPRLAAEARANVRAGAALYEHASPLRRVPELRTRAPEPADVLLGYFEEAQERFGVEWEVLAAAMLIETRMGRVVSRSSAGAQGPMQFLPAT